MQFALALTNPISKGDQYEGGVFQTVDQPGSLFNQLLGINQNGSEIAGYPSFTDVAEATGQQRSR